MKKKIVPKKEPVVVASKEVQNQSNDLIDELLLNVTEKYGGMKEWFLDRWEKLGFY